MLSYPAREKLYWNKGLDAYLDVCISARLTNMLILPNSCFLHVPKTGGSWAKEAIKASGIQYEEFAINNDPHVILKNCPCPEKFKIAFVRHPLQFYQSLWRYRMKTGWDWANPFDRDCFSDNFQTYVSNYLAKYPGYCSMAYEYYVSPPDNQIEFIGRYENLVNDLVKALKMAGEEFNEEIIQNYPPVNVTDEVQFPANYTDELEKAVREVEHTAIKRFGYE